MIRIMHLVMLWWISVFVCNQVLFACSQMLFACSQIMLLCDCSTLSCNIVAVCSSCSHILGITIHPGDDLSCHGQEIFLCIVAAQFIVSVITGHPCDCP